MLDARRSGVPCYDEPTRQIHGMAPWGGRTGLWYAIGTKQ